jgi:hypothetical protein
MVNHHTYQAQCGDALACATLNNDLEMVQTLLEHGTNAMALDRTVRKYSSLKSLLENHTKV